MLPVVASDAALELPGATEHPGYPLALGQPQQPRVELSTSLGYRGPLDHAGAAAIAFLLTTGPPRPPFDDTMNSIPSQWGRGHPPAHTAIAAAVINTPNHFAGAVG